MEELISTLDGTDYQKVLNDVYRSNSRELFDYELALDMFYFADMWHRVKRGMKAEDQQAILSSAGTQIDTLNLQWIYRAKKYYHMSAAQVYAMIIPIHYRLSREQIKRMAPNCGKFHSFCLKSTQCRQNRLKPVPKRFYQRNHGSIASGFRCSTKTCCKNKIVGTIRSHGCPYLKSVFCLTKLPDVTGSDQGNSASFHFRGQRIRNGRSLSGVWVYISVLFFWPDADLPEKRKGIFHCKLL